MRSFSLLLAVILALSGCAKSLPDRDTHDAQLYIIRCGSCHQLYAPRSLTPGMWEIQVAAMQDKIIAAGQPPLTSAEKAEILGYLKHNAGTQ